jgi:aminomethyltransferase
MTKTTVLYNAHKAAKAVFMDFAGWSMPLHYGSQIAEHNYVRTAAGMFDVSHMGVVDVVGTESKQFLSILLANDIDKLSAPGKALYSCMLNEAGGVIDDLIVYLMQDNYYRLVVNAGCTTKDLAWIQQQGNKYQVEIKHRNDLAIIAVQGPQALQKIANSFDIGLADQLQKLSKFSCLQYKSWFVGRTGYTGEDGVEIILPTTEAEQCWQSLSQQGIHPVGLGARDTLRLEAGLNLYGNDMDENVSPLESNLTWTVSFLNQGRNFIGRKALELQLISGLKQQLLAIVLKDKGVLRHGQKVLDATHEVGVVTSGSYSPTLQQAIGLIRVALPQNKDYFVEIRGIKHLVCVIHPPFVKKGKTSFNLI